MLPPLPEIDTQLFDNILSGLEPEVRLMVLRQAQQVVKSRPIEVKSEYLDSTMSGINQTGASIESLRCVEICNKDIEAPSSAGRFRAADKGKF